MKENIIKMVVAGMALVALAMLVGDMPGAGLARFVFVKGFALSLFWGATKVYDKFITEE